jgi:hypothetical protein
MTSRLLPGPAAAEPGSEAARFRHPAKKIKGPSLQDRKDRIVETDIPARLDNLRWGAFHTRVVTALGITWILDGLEVTLTGALSGALKDSPT